MAETVNENVFDLLLEDPRRIYVIAEAGLNHGGSKERALALVRAAKWAGADAIKFQIGPAERLASAQPEMELLKKLMLPPDAFRALFKEATRLNIGFMSTPVDEDSADFLDELGVSAFRIDARDITRRPLIEHVSRKNKPVLLSTGMSTGDEIESAIDWMHMQSNDRAILLHGVSSTGPNDQLHLKSIECLRERFGLPVGFSDHSIGSLGATVAVSVGAQVIERHLLIETRGDVADLAVSMDAKELKKHIEELRTIGRILGTRPNFGSKAAARPNVRPGSPFYPNVTVFPEHRSPVIGRYAQ